ncbi:hypothetical protein Cgig2_011800 [Carnegiea gigantea]|uniref:Uncharacterized protein n=1 Tax=Carnegiea gigantea TaxID=171969 RepID=A0A9Q1JLS7_9CARY|nr:hypothetical protein Cgig2_011800 [Carnegiea gigantea]
MVGSDIVDSPMPSTSKTDELHLSQPVTTLVSDPLLISALTVSSSFPLLPPLPSPSTPVPFISSSQFAIPITLGGFQHWMMSIPTVPRPVHGASTAATPFSFPFIDLMPQQGLSCDPILSQPHMGGLQNGNFLLITPEIYSFYWSPLPPLLPLPKFKPPPGLISFPSWLLLLLCYCSSLPPSPISTVFRFDEKVLFLLNPHLDHSFILLEIACSTVSNKASSTNPTT